MIFRFYGDFLDTLESNCFTLVDGDTDVDISQELNVSTSNGIHHAALDCLMEALYLETHHCGRFWDRVISECVSDDSWLQVSGMTFLKVMLFELLELVKIRPKVLPRTVCSTSDMRGAVASFHEQFPTKITEYLQGLKFKALPSVFPSSP